MVHTRVSTKALDQDTQATGGRGATASTLIGGALLYYLLALGCIYLSRQPQQIATMWLPDAFASIYLLLVPRPLRRWLVGMFICTIPLANLSYGDPLRLAISFVPANISQILLAAWLLERFVAVNKSVTDPWHLLKALTLAGVLPAILGACIAVLSVPFVAGTPLGPSALRLWASWVISTVFGVVTLLPLGLWVLSKGLDFGKAGRPLTLGYMLLLAVSTWAAMTWLPFPYVYVMAGLTLTALYGGFVVAALAALVLSVTLNAMFALGAHPPAGRDLGGPLMMVLPMLITVIPTVLIGAVREGLDARLKWVRQGEQLQRSMLDASPSFLCLVDQAGHILRMNSAGARMLGIDDPGSMQGQPIENWVQVASSTGSGMTVIKAFGGREVPVEWQVVPVSLHDGSSAALYAMRDVTAELEAQRMRERVAHSEAQSRAKSEFLSRMSHELRTPLNAILGFAQLMNVSIDRDSKEQQRNYLSQISHAGWHLLAMIDDVLNLARLDAAHGGESVKLEKVELQSLLKQACDMVQAEASRSGVNVSLVEASSAFVTADSLRLRQVLINLLSNAIKYNQSGGSVRVSCRRLDTHWRIEVSDTGVGISAEQQMYVFEPFNRLDHEGSDIKGTGIGLSITRKLIETMHGDIGFSSETGGGSTFWVSLPASTD